jgi:K+-sensing histidine kinase KdpD
MNSTLTHRSDAAPSERDAEKLLDAISHDLREPARTIRSFAQMLLADGGEPLDEKRASHIRRITQAAERLESLLDGLLSYSRAQRLVRPNRWVDGSDLVAAAIRRENPRIRQCNATVHVAEPLPKLYVDHEWILESLHCLLDNALKFTQEGQPPDVAIAAYEPREGESVAGLVIRDRGVGVDSSQRERVFDLFQRSVGRQIEGVGAGLAVAREVARRHGGNAWMEPRADGGSDFFLTVAAEPAIAPHPLSPQ